MPDTTALRSARRTGPSGRVRSLVAAAPRANVTALPEPVNLDLYRGDDFTLTLTLTDPASGDPADLEGYTPTAQIRVQPDDEDIAGSFTCSRAGNVVTCDLPSTVSAQLPPRGVWDCQVVSDDGRVTTLVAGTVTVRADVTRP